MSESVEGVHARTLAYASFEDVAVVRLALFESIRNAALPTVITTFETETVAAGRRRRLEKWTPVQRAKVPRFVAATVAGERDSSFAADVADE